MKTHNNVAAVDPYLSTHYGNQWLGAVNTVVTLGSRLQAFCAAGIMLAFERGLCLLRPSLRSVVNNHTHTHTHCNPLMALTFIRKLSHDNTH
jgi:hypothetical protein